MQAANSSCRNLNVEGLDAFDLRTVKENGQPWDFTRAADRAEARERCKSRRPKWLIGSPPCTYFSTLMQLNFSRMDPEHVKRVMAEARLHLHFTISLYYDQLLRGDQFLHEHPPPVSVLVEGPSHGCSLASPSR